MLRDNRVLTRRPDHGGEKTPRHVGGPSLRLRWRWVPTKRGLNMPAASLTNLIDREKRPSGPRVRSRLRGMLIANREWSSRSGDCSRGSAVLLRAVIYAWTRLKPRAPSRDRRLVGGVTRNNPRR